MYSVFLQKGKIYIMSTKTLFTNKIKLVFNLLIATLLTSISYAQNYDFALRNVQITNPTGISSGSSINQGTLLNQVSFDVVNAGSNSIPAGTRIDVRFEVGSFSVNLAGAPGSAIASGGSITFTVDCTPGGATTNGISFPSSTGNFNICVTITNTNDVNGNNNKSCTPYSMTSPRPDLRIKPGSITITNPAGLNPNAIPIGTAFNQFRFVIENIGGIGLGQGSTIAIVMECNGVTRNSNYTLTSNLNANDTLPLFGNATAAALNLNFPTVAGAFDICVTVNVSIDPNSSNNKLCSQFVMGSSTPNPPNITNMSPTSGPIGTAVDLTGTDLPTSGFTVEFNGITANVISSSSNQIKVTVPTGATSGQVRLIYNGSSYLAGTFTVTGGGGGNNVNITSVAPNAGVVGNEISINGSGFSTTTTSNAVTFSGGVNATVTSATATRLRVRVPSGAQTGVITVSVGGNSAQSSVFTVHSSPQMVITDFNPKKGAIGQNITIYGNLFAQPFGNNTVTFSGGATATVVNGSDKQLVVEVPASAQNGVITVNNGSTTATTPENFTLETGPVIVRLNPNSGKAGSAVTIEGFNFSSVDNENTILFGSIDAGLPIVNQAATELEVTVPPGLSAGQHTVRLTVKNFSTITAPTKYTVLDEASSIIELNNTNGLSIFDNQEGLNVSIQTKNAMQNSKITIYNLQGVKVFEEGFYVGGETQHTHVADVQLTSGVYVLSFEDKNNETQVKKFVVAQ